MTQQQLATAAGLSILIVSQVEQGKTPDPRGSTLRALAKALGVGLDALFAEPADAPDEGPKHRGRKKRDG